MNEPKQIMNVRTKEIVEHPGDTVLIQSTYLNNFWVVGSPDGTYGYYDEQCVADFEKDRINDPDYYNVYALGEWGVIRTGSEFSARSKEDSIRESARIIRVCLFIFLSIIMCCRSSVSVTGKWISLQA